MNTTYRMYNPEDIDALVQFWRENSGWDQIDRTEWERRFYFTPFGPASVVMALNEQSGEIEGQIIFIPTEINVDGKVIKACRPFSLVFSKRLRTKLRFPLLLQIITKMYGLALKNMKARGVQLIHMMPDPGWSRALKFLSNAQVGSFWLWSLSLPLQQPFAISPAYTLRLMPFIDEQLDMLCSKNDRLYGCILPRTSATLAWKTSHGEYRLLGVYKENQLVGFSASQIKEKDKQWLLCDMLAADGTSALQTTLKATCNLAHDYLRTHPTPISKIALLVPPSLQEAVESLGFQKDNYRFPFVIQVLDEKITQAQVAPERWYTSAND